MSRLLLRSALALLVSSQPALAEDARLVLVLPFENLTRTKAHVAYETSDAERPLQREKSYVVDRYSHAPRGIIEDLLVGFEGVHVVERQRLDAVMTQLDLPLESGLYDSRTAIQLGNLLGANTLVLGTVEALSEDRDEFRGYGVQGGVVEVTAKLRVRVVDVESRGVVFSTRVAGSESFLSTQFGGMKAGDVAFSVIEKALEQLREDDEFLAFFRDASSAPQHFVEVRIRPTPNKSDVIVDGVYVGGSPRTIQLPEGKPTLLTIRRGGFEVWEATIRPFDGQVVEPALRPADLRREEHRRQ